MLPTSLKTPEYEYAETVRDDETAPEIARRLAESYILGVKTIFLCMGYGLGYSNNGPKFDRSKSGPELAAELREYIATLPKEKLVEVLTKTTAGCREFFADPGSIRHVGYKNLKFCDAMIGIGHRVHSCNSDADHEGDHSDGLVTWRRDMVTMSNFENVKQMTGRVVIPQEYVKAWWQLSDAERTSIEMQIFNADKLRTGKEQATRLSAIVGPGRAIFEYSRQDDQDVWTLTDWYNPSDALLA